MDQDVTVKASCLEDLHKIAVDMIKLANRFTQKYPQYLYSLQVDHSNLELTFKCVKNTESDE